MNDTTQTLLRSVLKIGAGYAVAKGYTDDNHAEMIIAGLAALAGVVWGIAHRNQGAPQKVTITQRTSGSLPPVVMLLSLSLTMFITGCASSPSKAHVVRIVGTGTKVGIAQNPATQMYELGLLRFQTELTTIPVFFTNGVFSLPDVVSSYEVNGGSAVFGRIGLTSTLATGTNAVGTLLGGMHQPVNAGIGASNNIVNLAH